MRKLTPDNAVSRKQFPYFVRVSQVGNFAHYKEICSWTKQRWGSPSRLHKDSLWACQIETSTAGDQEMWAWFRYEEDVVLFTLTWC